MEEVARFYSGFPSYVRKFCEQASEEILVFSPYIRVKMLDWLLERTSRKINIAVITDWDVTALSSGALDIELYPFCSEKKIVLRHLPKLHAKTWIFDRKVLINSSANVTQTGYSFNTSGNWEFMNSATKLSKVDEYFIVQAIKNSREITAEIYEKTLEILPEIALPKIEISEQLFSNEEEGPRDGVIPESDNVLELYKMYRSEDFEEASVRHDCFWLNIGPNLSEEEFVSCLYTGFFRLPFTRKILKEIEENNNSIRFGKLRKLILGVKPQVSKEKATRLTSNFYNWILGLAGGCYTHEVFRPNHSEILIKVNESQPIQGTVHIRAEMYAKRCELCPDS